METKETLIQMFMTEFDNSEFKDVILEGISREEIETLLKENIKELKHISKENGFTGYYDLTDKNIYINDSILDRIKANNNTSDLKISTEEMLKKHLIIHEMWHAISNRIHKFKTIPISDKEIKIIYNDKDIKDLSEGRMISGTDGLKKDKLIGEKISDEGLAYTEGMTELLTDLTCGYSVSTAYPHEKEVITLLRHFADFKNMISDYTDGTSKIEEELEKKYGEVFLLNYRTLRKNMDEYTKIGNKLIGEYELENGESKDSLLEEQKDKKQFTNKMIRNMVRREKIRVEKVNTLESYEDYSILLDSLSQSEEFKNLEISEGKTFDLEEEMEVNTERIAQLREKTRDNKNEDLDIKSKIESATSEVTISEVNNQIQNVSQLMIEKREKESQKEI